MNIPRLFWTEQDYYGTNGRNSGYVGATPQGRLKNEW
jgi:hypothetical protein